MSWRMELSWRQQWLVLGVVMCERVLPEGFVAGITWLLKECLVGGRGHEESFLVTKLRVAVQVFVVLARIQPRHMKRTPVMV